jgi:osmotically-inducible protein OsmY
MRVAGCSAVFLVLVGCGALAGCSPISTAIGAAAYTADLATQERGLYQGLDDNRMWIAINARFAAADLNVAQNVHLQVQEGRVLLSGVVQTQEQRLAAVKAAWDEPGVREVINDVEIANSRDVGQITQDQYLAQRVWLKLFVDRAVRANNYSVECINDVVYLIGVGQTEDEVQRAIDHARDVPYVRDVKNYVRLKTDPLPPEPLPPAKAPEILPAETQPGLRGGAQASRTSP